MTYTTPIYYTDSELTFPATESGTVTGIAAGSFVSGFTGALVNALPNTTKVVSIIVATGTGLYTQKKVQAHFDGNRDLTLSDENGQNEMFFPVSSEQYSATVVSAVIFGIAAFAGIKGLPAIAFSIAGDLIYSTVTNASATTAWVDDITTPDVHLKLYDSADQFLAGSVYKHGLDRSQIVSDALPDFIAQNFVDTEIPAFTAGMKMKVYENGGEDLYTTYTLYDGDILGEVAASFGKNIDTNFFNYDPQTGLPSGYSHPVREAVWGSMPTASSGLNPIENIYFDNNGSPLVFVRPDDVLMISGLTSTSGSSSHYTYGSDFSMDDVIEDSGIFSGTAKNNIIKGSGGNDTIHGGKGDDIILAGAGTDAIHGEEGDDYIDGGSGQNGIFYDDGGRRGVQVYLGGDGFGVANDSFGGRDLLKNIDDIFGTDHNDVLEGDQYANIINGGDGYDMIKGGAGNDTLYGGGDDNIFVFGAGHGHDIIMDWQSDPSSATDSYRLDGITVTGQSRSGDDIILTTGTNSSITIVDYFVGDDQEGRPLKEIGDDGLVKKWYYDDTATIILEEETDEIHGLEELSDWVPAMQGKYDDAETTVSPLIFDLGTGLNLTQLGSSSDVYWNINPSTSFAHRTAWITGGTGLLAIDANADGVINDHSELFGNETTDGFTVLSAHDSNSDGVINSSDTNWSDLLMWVDSNQNGYSEDTELKSMSDLGITSINLSATTVNYDIAGNPVTHQSTFVMNGQTKTVVDAWFAYDVVNTVYAGSYTFDALADNLMDMRGYGGLPKLSIAMMLDNDQTNSDSLISLVKELSEFGFARVRTEANQVDDMVEKIMLRWAGVDGIDPNTRGNFMDARKLAFLEEILGDDFIGTNGYADPLVIAADVAMEAWGIAHQAITARLTYQIMGGDTMFVGAPKYDPVSDTFGSTTGIDFNELGLFISGQPGVAEQMDAARIAVSWIEELIGVANLSPADTTSLEALLPGGLSLEAISNTIYSVLDDSNGDANDNVMLATSEDNLIYGNGGNDVFLASEARNVMYGGDGDDVYMFSLGDAALFGPGSSINHYNQIIELYNGGTDTLQIGVDFFDTTYSWTENGVFYLQYSDDDVLYLSAGNTTNGASRIGERLEKITFNDGHEINLSTGLYLKNNDVMHTIKGSNNSDVIDSGVGGSTSYAYDGDDLLISGEGRALLYGGLDNDTYQFGIGDASVNGSQYSRVIELYNQGTDKLHLTDGVVTDDIYIWSGNYGALYIQYSDTDIIDVAGSLATNGASRVGEKLEKIVLDDATELDLSSGLYLRNNDTSHNLVGSNFSDVLDSGVGGGTHRSYDGDDTLIAGLGREIFYGGLNNDTYVFGYDDALVSGSSYGKIIELYNQGTDTLNITGGVTIDDIYAWSGSYGTIYVQYSDDDIIEISGGTASNGASRVGERLEKIVFDDATEIDLSSGLYLRNTDTSKTLTGSNGDDTIIAGSVNDVLWGYDGADTLQAGVSGNDTLRGGNGNDVIIGGEGNNNLFGDNNADIFKFMEDTAFGSVDYIKDYDDTESDVIDIADLLTAYDSVSDDIVDFVSLTASGSHTTLAVDTDGTGSAYGFRDVARIDYTTGLNLNDMITNGELIVE